MPIVRTESDFGPGGYGTGIANIPGIPAFSINEQFKITTGSNDVLKLSYDGGAVTDITLSSGCYTYTSMAAKIGTQVNAAFTITSTVSFEATAENLSTKFTIAVTAGHTIALTYTGSTAADTLGFDSDKTAAVSITSDDYVHGTGTITFTFSANNNHAVVTYAIYSNTQIKYVGADGIADEAAEVWQTIANWNNGGAAGTVTVNGLTDYTSYTFKVKARNEAGTETAFSANSAVMNTYPILDFSIVSAALNREITSGNTKVDSDTSSGAETEISISGEYGDITVTYSLINDSLTASRIVVEYSEDGTNYSTATEGTGGDGLTALATSAAGTSHTFVWDSYIDAGTSEYKADTVYLRITPYDASPTGGDAGEPRVSPVFTVDNRPVTVTVLNSDTFTFGKDTTPIFQAIMTAIRGGDKLWHRIKIYDSNDSLQFIKVSAIDVTGWEYENTPNNWNAVPVSGIPVANIDGVNRVRYTVQAGDALTADNDENFQVFMEQAEIRDRS